jgi:site-specific DNA-methyltransferase (adenine-specific)
MGDGPCGVAALEMGRKFIGIEIDEKYYEVAKRRLENELAQLKLF